MVKYTAAPLIWAAGRCGEVYGRRLLVPQLDSVEKYTFTGEVLHIEAARVPAASQGGVPGDTYVGPLCGTSSGTPNIRRTTCRRQSTALLLVRGAGPTL